MDIEELQKKVIEFRDALDWGQYHNPKDLAISLMLEAAELLEIFQWKDAQEVEAIKSDPESRRRFMPLLLSDAREGVLYFGKVEQENLDGGNQSEREFFHPRQEGTHLNLYK